jgi:hypothetical protein
MKTLITAVAFAALVAAPAVAKTANRYVAMDAYAANARSMQDSSGYLNRSGYNEDGYRGGYNEDGYYVGHDPDPNIQLDLRRDDYRE